MEQNRRHFHARLKELDTERSTFVTQWRDISKYLQPLRGRFLLTDRNRGGDRHNTIIDNTGTRAHRVMSAGLMASMTSPARPWFRLTLTDTELADRPVVKSWLTDVTQIMRNIFTQSNTYRGLHSVYDELGLFGTASSIVDDSFDDVVRLHTLTAGEYYIAHDHEQRVNTLYREFDMQVGPLVQMFGEDKLSTSTKTLYNRGSVDKWVTVVHAIEPRMEREPGKRDAVNMPWKSVYFEKNNREHEYLRESGYREFRVLAPRWLLVGGDVYGSGPAAEALGDVKALQRSQLMKGKAIDYMADPPTQVPHTMKETADLLPGGVSFYNGAEGPNGGIRTAFEVNLDINALREDIVDTRDRIEASFFADLFLMISRMDEVRTATEIAARQEEKLLMLGPVLERLHNEMLDPLIDITFSRALRLGILPPPPPDLEGTELKVEYVSMLAQAQQAVGLGSVDRLLGTVGSVAQFKPEAVDKLNTDELVDHYADLLGVDPDIIVANEDVAIVREQRAAQQQQAAAAEMAPGAAQAAKTLSDVDPQQLAAVVNQGSGL